MHKVDDFFKKIVVNEVWKLVTMVYDDHYTRYSHCEKYYKTFKNSEEQFHSSEDLNIHGIAGNERYRLLREKCHVIKVSHSLLFVHQ